MGKQNLEVGFALKMLQRLSQPHIATGNAVGTTTHTPEVRSPRSSRTRGNSSHVSLRPHRITTELALAVLNPARVPL